MVRTDKPIPKPVLEERIIELGAEIEYEIEMMQEFTLGDWGNQVRLSVERSIQEKLGWLNSRIEEYNSLA